MPNQEYPTTHNSATNPLGLPAVAVEPRETPRGKRERIHRHYSKVLSMALSALYDGKPKRFPGRDYIEYVISALGYDGGDEWAYISDEDLIKANFVGLHAREDVAIAREVERIQKQRAKLNAAQAEAGNPILIEHEAEYDYDAKKNRSRYKLPICELIRDIVAECPVGTPDKKLRVAVVRQAVAYRARFDGSAKRARPKREHSPDSNAKRAATFAYEAFEQERQKSGAPGAATLIKDAFKAKFGDLYFAVFGDLEKIKSNEIQAVSVETCSKTVGGLETQERTGLECAPERKPAPQSGGPRPLVGQDRDEFCRDNFPAELDVGGTVEKASTQVDGISTGGPTPKMRAAIERTGHLVPASFSEASALIGQLSAAGAFSQFYSLEELERYDPKAGGRNRKERRFCCPNCGGDKPMDDEHRSLSLNTSSGAYHCHRCEVAGVAREYAGDSSAARVFIHTGPVEPEPKSEKWPTWWKDAKPVAGTPGAKYLATRAVPIEAAVACDVKCGPWFKRGDDGPARFPAVIFPFKNLAGQVVAAQARAIEGKTKRTGGELSQGVFWTRGAMDAQCVAVVEAPIDALILYACGLEAIALGGTAIQDWVVDFLAGKDVALATDADEAGDQCAAKFASLLADRATFWRLRPDGAKDWGEVAEVVGLDAVSESVIVAMERTPEVGAML